MSRVVLSLYEYMSNLLVYLLFTRRAHLDKLVEYIEKGVSEGARLVAGGKRVARKGFYLEPTVFADVTDRMFIAQEESLGPIMIISKFHQGFAAYACSTRVRVLYSVQYCRNISNMASPDRSNVQM